MIVTTTPGIEGRNIHSYLGIVAGEGYRWVDLVRLFSTPASFMAERKQIIAAARVTALEELASAAASLGADAVVGVQLDHEIAGPNGSAFLVTASGTAVKLG